MRRSSIAVLGSVAAVAAGVMPATAASAARDAGARWSPAQCERAVRAWSHRHPRASLKQLSNYDHQVVAAHGCRFGHHK